MQLFSIVILYIMVVLTSIITCRFLILFSSSKNKLTYYIVYIVINVLLSCFLENVQFYIPSIISQFINISIAFAYSQLVLKVDAVLSLLASLLNGVIFGVYNILVFAISGILLRETHINQHLIMILNSATMLVLSTVTLEVFIRRYGKHKSWSHKYSALYMCPLTFIYIVIQTLINIAYNPVAVIDKRMQFSTSTSQDIQVLFAICICVISIYVILYFYEKVMGQIEVENKMSALEAYTEMQKQYINEARQKYESTRAFRHDVQNHILTLSGLVQSNETKKVNEYLNRFENETKNLSFEVFTGNAVLDILFKEKFGFAREQGIQINCDAIIPENLMVEDFDLCIIFFNALDNAIKGCEYANEKYIDVAAKKNKGFFVIDIINSFNIAKYEKGSGIGLETIKFVTEKYGGYLDISTDNNVFRVSIMFSLK